MILDELNNWRRYAALAELKTAFEFLEQNADGTALRETRVEIDGDRVFALPQSYRPKPVSEGRFEAHRRYADVQYVASGREMIGHAPGEPLTAATPYDPEKDLIFYAQPASYSALALPAGWFAVFYPNEAHMPGCRLDSDEQVRKIVVKVLMEEQK